MDKNKGLLRWCLFMFLIFIGLFYCALAGFERVYPMPVMAICHTDQECHDHAVQHGYNEEDYP